jgi:hypothetical protein
MPHVERKVEIKAPRENIFKILDDTISSPIWNLAVKEVSKIEEGKFAVKSTVGDFTTIRTETLENEKMSMDIEGGIFTSMGYRLNPIGDMVETTIWGDFDDEKNEKMLTKAGELLLQSLKGYVEFLEEGGNPKDFDKKRLTVTP